MDNSEIKHLAIGIWGQYTWMDVCTPLLKRQTKVRSTHTRSTEMCPLDVLLSPKSSSQEAKSWHIKASNNSAPVSLLTSSFTMLSSVQTKWIRLVGTWHIPCYSYICVTCPCRCSSIHVLSTTADPPHGRMCYSDWLTCRNRQCQSITKLQFRCWVYIKRLECSE